MFISAFTYDGRETWTNTGPPALITEQAAKSLAIISSSHLRTHGHPIPHHAAMRRELVSARKATLA